MVNASGAASLTLADSSLSDAGINPALLPAPFTLIAVATYSTNTPTAILRCNFTGGATPVSKYGLAAYGGTVQVYRCTFSGNSLGISASNLLPGSYVNDCTIAGNGTGISNAGPGVLDTRWNWWGD